MDTVATWQRTAGAGVGRTTLVGFSQGAIMSLEATQLQALHADVSLDLVDGLGHGIDARMLARMLARLHQRLDAPA